MNKITKENIYELLEDKLKVTPDEEEELIKLVNELFDINKNAVIPLDNEETFAFRQRYGILNNGVPQSKEAICREYNIGYKKFSIIMERVFVKLLFRIKKMNNYTKIDKINSLNTNDEKILNLSVSSLPINTLTKKKLMKEFIFTLQDLMEYGINELKHIIGVKELNNLIDFIHSLNFKFLNELTDEEKKEIIDNNNIEVIGNSSPYFISGLDKYPYYDLKSKKIEDVRSLVKNVFIFPTNDRIELMSFISKNNLSCLGREEESKKL